MLLDMMRMGGTRQVAELGVALVDAGAVMLACSAARALLRWERARGWPVGMAALEVIRCATSSGNCHVQIDGAHKEGKCSGTRPLGALMLVCNAPRVPALFRRGVWLICGVAVPVETIL